MQMIVAYIELMIFFHQEVAYFYKLLLKENYKNMILYPNLIQINDLVSNFLLKICIFYPYSFVQITKILKKIILFFKFLVFDRQL